MPSPRPFRFGVASVARRPSAEAWAELARRAEALGYATLLVPDHVDARSRPSPP